MFAFMCFSATASFGIGAALAVTGVFAIKQAKNEKQLPFALIPILFSIQQLAEGIVWLSFTNSFFESWQTIAVNVYLLFALILWSVWLPLAARLMENNVKRKRLLNALVMLGALVAVFLGFCVWRYGAYALVDAYHVRYRINFDYAFTWYNNLIYLLPVTFAPMVSSVKAMKWFGWLVLLSYVVTVMVYEDNVVSIWCLFSAVMSGVVVWVLRIENRLKQTFAQPILA